MKKQFICTKCENWFSSNASFDKKGHCSVCQSDEQDAREITEMGGPRPYFTKKKWESLGVEYKNGKKVLHPSQKQKHKDYIEQCRLARERNV